jgi:hypothetical protein
MADSINLASAYFGDGEEPPDERLVQLYLEQMRNGVGIPAALLVRTSSDDRFLTIDEESRAKVEAAVRSGGRTIDAYIIDDPGPEKLRELRRELKAQRQGRN